MEKCYEQTNGFSKALYRSFPYKTELEKEDENKEGSLRHAFMLAEKYMSEFGIGELQLVYQGGKKDYLEEDSWKKEGFRIARKYAPAILFVDEIDAIGMKREYSNLPNPVLNALLTEVDVGKTHQKAE